MTEFRLSRRPALAGMTHEFAGAARLAVQPEAWLLTLSFNAAQQTAVAKRIGEALGCGLPDIGRSTICPTGRRLLRPRRDRILVLDMQAAAPDWHYLSGVGYPVDQSDYWVVLELAGPLAASRLGRCCRLDLHHAALTEGAVQPTMVSSMAATLVRTSLESFLILVPRSYARSLVDRLTVSLRFLIGG